MSQLSKEERVFVIEKSFERKKLIAVQAAFPPIHMEWVWTKIEKIMEDKVLLALKRKLNKSEIC